MHELSEAQRTALQQLHVHLDHPREGMLTVEQLLTPHGHAHILDRIKNLSQTPTPPVAASIFMRRYGFFITALLKLFSTESVRWTGSLADVAIIQANNTVHFTLSPSKFEKSTSLHRSTELQRILEQYGHPVVLNMSQSAKISKLILWENIWGYVIWMYGQLFADPACQQQAERDVATLLEDELWTPHMRRSPFQLFLRNRSLTEAMREYERVTCCLYKELPDTDKCPYCPLSRKRT